MRDTLDAPLPATSEQVIANLPIADCYVRLHDRLSGTATLFDASWECEPTSLQDRLRWADRLFRAALHRLPPTALFDDVIERLVLLNPAPLQQLLCAVSLLARRDDLRRCVDGAAVRRLQAVVGTSALASILRSSLPQAAAADADLGLQCLLAQGFSRLTHAYAGHWPVVLQCLRLAMPARLPTVACNEDAQQVARLLWEAHHWYPELTWLYG